LDEVLVSRHKAMDPRYFNFRSGRWEIEWGKVSELRASPLPLGRKARAEPFDLFDLLVIKELEKDSLQHLTEIARKLKVHQKTLEYHYRTHVQRWKLVTSYRIRWVQDTTKRLTHSTATTRMAFRNLSRVEYAQLQAAVSKIPFLWSEDLLTNGDYITSLYVPVTDLLSVSNYISAAVPNLSSRLEMSFVAPADASSFTVPYNMFQDGEWKFNVKQMEAALRKEAAIPLQK